MPIRDTRPLGCRRTLFVIETKRIPPVPLIRRHRVLRPGTAGPAEAALPNGDMIRRQVLSNTELVTKSNLNRETNEFSKALTQTSNCVDASI